MSRRYAKTLQFLAIYLQEAHPLDGVLPERQTGRWLMGTPERRLFIEDPITQAERLELAKHCADDMELGFPMLVDGLDDAVSTAYRAWPERLYVIDLDGTVIYRSDYGPDGYLMPELADVLAACAEPWARGQPAAGAARAAVRKGHRSRESRRNGDSLR